MTSQKEPLSAAQLVSTYVGKTARITVLKTIGMEVDIRDVKFSYGKLRYLVAPISGEGQAWVETVELI